MSTDKISIQELVDELSAKAGITKRVAEDFVKTLFGTIEDTLVGGDSVKIKDFGTFKLQSIEARKSVNVQTGEEITIPGYNKAIFVPETNLKELINEPFAHLEAVVLDDIENNNTNDKLRNFSEQADEIKSIMLDIEALSSKKNKEEQETEIEINHKQIIEMKEEEIEYQPVQSEPEMEPATDESLNDLFYEKPRRGWLWILLIVLILLIGAGVYIFMACPDVADKLKFWDKQQAPVEEVVVEVTEKIEQPAEDTADELQLLFESPRVYTEYLATVKLPEGSRLARLSQLYYGHPYFWIYIYEANMDKIKHPNVIPTGTLIRVPKVNPLLIDVCNPRCLEMAHEAEPSYLK